MRPAIEQLISELRDILNSLPEGPWYVEQKRPGREDEARIYDRHCRGVCKLTTGQGPDVLRNQAQLMVALHGRTRDLLDALLSAETPQQFERHEPAADLKAAGEAMTADECDEMLECIRQILDAHLLNGATHCHMIRWKLRQLAAAETPQVASGVAPLMAVADHGHPRKDTGGESGATSGAETLQAWQFTREEYERQADFLADVGHKTAAALLREASRHAPSSQAAETPRTGNHYGRPLEVAIEHDALVISIGLQTLAHAVSYADWANPFDEEAHDFIRTFAIADVRAFAKEVRRAMLNEREDGSSPLSDFIDRATSDAIDDGAEGCEFDQRIKHGTTSPLETWAAETPREEK